jgi:hydroxylaminobenzene mutase
MLLFLLGLLTGLAEPHFANLRMALAAHLEGVMNGIFLVALGAALDALRLSTRQSATLFWTALIGTYANWGATTLAAAFGTAALSPITSAGHHGQPWQENLITLAFVAVAGTIIACAVLAMIGARREGAPYEHARR